MDNITHVMVALVLQQSPRLLTWEKCGSYDRVVRTFAWVYCFINNLAAETPNQVLIRGKPLIQAEQRVTRSCQP